MKNIGIAIHNERDKILLAIVKARKEKGFSQYDMAYKIHVSQNSYFKIEKGKTKLDLERLLLIANILELDLSYLFKDSHVLLNNNF